ncbi:hypothetical protein RCO48_07855 [Peribacillus frigoritolerans]|nr:hypothetical protein [Peribacillus frigoritolerans]
MQKGVIEEGAIVENIITDKEVRVTSEKISNWFKTAYCNKKKRK